MGAGEMDPILGVTKMAYGNWKIEKILRKWCLKANRDTIFLQNKNAGQGGESANQGFARTALVVVRGLVWVAPGLGGVFSCTAYFVSFS